ncbi:MAG: hypothetical protein LBV17_01535 [Treponema sp.]|jgi:hypothetical protein|nr:hypothetical protein [Treponema sp.]
MCLQKSAKIFLFLAALAVLGGCGPLDSIIPSPGTYKINAKVNETSLDDFSIITSKDKILPFFEDPVSEDPDITELVVFLKDSRGLLTGYKVTYSITYTSENNNNEEGQTLQSERDNSKTEKQGEATIDKSGENKEDKSSADEKSDKEKKDAIAETDPLEKIEHIKKDNEIIFPVKSLDDALPFIPLPSDLPIGKYTLVYQVMGKNTILFKTEKFLFYLADSEFFFEGIQVHLPGIAESSQFIQNGNIILLDIKLDFDSRLEPYIVWYNGKKIIDEGSYSDGTGKLLWKAPEQNGFVSLRAEVFPSWDRTGLAGSQKGISLLVSSKEVDMHLLPADTPNLVQLYTFEGDLNESLSKNSEKLVIKPAGENKLNWLPSNGTYGLASGFDNAYTLPIVSFSNDENESWQIISRFNPVNEGEIFSVQFGPAFNITMTLSKKESSLVLTLADTVKTYSEVLNLPGEKDSFVTASVKFFTQSGKLYSKLDLEKPVLEKNQNEQVVNPISIEAHLDKEFIITLGQQSKNLADNAQTPAVQKQAFTALWDELAILRLPLTVEVKTVKNNNREVAFEEINGGGGRLITASLPETTDAKIPGNYLSLSE